MESDRGTTMSRGELWKEIENSGPQEWDRWDREYVWHPFTQMREWLSSQNLTIVAAEGNYLIDADGKRYFDGVSSLWVTIHGHKHPCLNKAILGQLNRVAHTTYLGLAHDMGAKLARALTGILPRPLKRVFYSDNGSTAVEIALKMAYQYWSHHGQKRPRFLSLENAYHGDTLGAVGVGGIDVFHTAFGPIIVKSLKAPSPYCYRCPLRLKRETCDLACADELEQILTQHRDHISAIIVEPEVQAAAGMIVMPEGYIQRVSAAARTHGVLLIYDEVATGFGRTGRLFAMEHSGTVPDFVALAKGITGGYLPLAATITTEDVFEAFLGSYEEFKTFFHGHTYTANPLACAASLENLKILTHTSFLQRIEKLARTFSCILEEQFGAHPNAGDIRIKGLMAGVELVKDRKKREPFSVEKRVAWRTTLKVRERGLILRPLGDVLVFMPPLSSTEDELQFMVETARWALDEVLSS